MKKMKPLLYVLIYLIMTIALLLVVALSSRMHLFLAIPVVIIAMFGFALASVHLDSWL